MGIRFLSPSSRIKQLRVQSSFLKSNLKTEGNILAQSSHLSAKIRSLQIWWSQVKLFFMMMFQVCSNNENITDWYRISIFRKGTYRYRRSTRARSQSWVHCFGESYSCDQMDKNWGSVSHFQISFILTTATFTNWCSKTESSFTHEGEVLLIKSLDRESSGRYKCQAANDIEPALKKIIHISFKGILQSIS